MWPMSKHREAIALSKDAATRDMIDLAKSDAADPYGTHYDGCWRVHPKCRALMIALELEARLVDESAAEAQQMQGVIDALDGRLLGEVVTLRAHREAQRVALRELAGQLRVKAMELREMGRSETSQRIGFTQGPLMTANWLDKCADELDALSASPGTVMSLTDPHAWQPSEG